MEIQPGIDIYLGDCLEVMSDIPGHSADAIICDLPYGTTSCHWDSVIPLEPLWAHYKRIVKPKGAIVLTASQPFTTALIASNMAWFKYCWVWEKSNVGGVMSAKNRPLKSHEDVCVFSNGTTANGSDNRTPYYPQDLVRVNRKRGNHFRRDESDVSAVRSRRPCMKSEYVQEFTNYPRSVLKFDNPTNGSLHPTQKPIALMEYLIRTYTNEGELVLDNTFGSCTTGVACINTDRRFIGIEKEPNYFAIGERRISEALRSRAERKLVWREGVELSAAGNGNSRPSQVRLFE